MSATTTRSVWDKALPTLSGFCARPEGPQVAEYVRQWLVVLAAHPDMAAEFDDALEAYARDLRASGLLIADQRSGFLLAVYARLFPTDPTRDELIRQVDRRMAKEGRRYCHWRGTVPAHEWDAWRFDEAVRRAALKNKGVA